MELIQNIQNLVNNSEYISEHNLQTIVVRYFKELYPKWIVFSVPNGGTRNKIEMQSLKTEGLLAGVSDLIVIAEFPTIYFIEMKVKNGKTEKAQIEFKNKLEALGWNFFLIKKK